ncbi:hypothetical protein [Roseimicrobium sp. ORNL1]|uniref:hypothetical protein n=1 Tax=Roseimicrobium sp. ORNL1 TaxID=2711231 RepID=UPI0013E10703|nr:hypothetical protein [Roseimicrobium sp. ORNL1]QIF05275.1 hypothetical protein G5S37_28450 [Roseimicrobium sp. ORNL1]
MTLPQDYAPIIALFIAIPVVACALYLLAGWLLGRQRRACPACAQKEVRCVQWIRATVLIDGRRAPDSWCYYLCDACGARFKQHLGKDYEVPSDEEWEAQCSEAIKR